MALTCNGVQLTRGERNNDPGNLNFIPLGRAFNGELRVETLPDGHPGRFGVYDSMFDGVRAAAEEVLIKVLNQELTNADSLIGDDRLGWAPAKDGNHPTAYVAALVGYVNRTWATPLNAVPITAASDLRMLVKLPQFLRAITGGIFIVENGRFPIGLEPRDHLAACVSALAARGYS